MVNIDILRVLKEVKVGAGHSVYITRDFGSTIIKKWEFIHEDSDDGFHSRYDLFALTVDGDDFAIIETDKNQEKITVTVVSSLIIKTRTLDKEWEADSIIMEGLLTSPVCLPTYKELYELLFGPYCDYYSEIDKFEDMKDDDENW